ncbi:MAG: DNA alkylation repair protein [Eggerthellaceae bacterium]
MRLFLSSETSSTRSFIASSCRRSTPTALSAYASPRCAHWQKSFATQSHAFFHALPHRYFEENNLHGFLIEHMNDFDDVAEALDEFLPHIDNWATCDSISPKTFSKHPDKLLAKIDEWLSSDKAFTVRFAIGMLMKHFLMTGSKKDS